jgi:alpha-L-rhamnosidase
VWLLQSVGGIQPHPAAKGMDKILIKPAPPTQLQHASASFSTPRGTITTSWRRETGGKLVLNCTIPPNVKATVHVPSRVGTDVTEGVETLDGGQHVGIGRTARAFEVGSGSYSFRSFV